MSLSPEIPFKNQLHISHLRSWVHICDIRKCELRKCDPLTTNIKPGKTKGCRKRDHWLRKSNVSLYQSTSQKWPQGRKSDMPMPQTPSQMRLIPRKCEACKCELVLAFAWSVAPKTPTTLKQVPNILKHVWNSPEPSKITTERLIPTKLTWNDTKPYTQVSNDKMDLFHVSKQKFDPDIHKVNSWSKLEILKPSNCQLSAKRANSS